jgi:hypothetical protein
MSIPTSKSSILSELASRATKITGNKVELSGNFPQQNAFIDDPSRFLTAQCGRRSGKTTGLAIKFFKTLETHAKAQCLYLALTRESAREILWPVLIDIDDKYKLGCTFLESKLTMKHPNGSSLALYGADQKNFVKRLRGRKYPGVGIDEAQDMGPHLQSLIDDVLMPAIADYEDSWLAMTGTPGPVPAGYFFEATMNGKYGYSRHGWTILDNPHMPNPEKIINEIKEKNQWDESNPTLRREWRNQWVLDVNSLWVRYNEKINDYDHLPLEKFQYIMGVDIGYRDSDAIAILGWSEVSKTVYLIEEVITPKQDITDLTNQIKSLQTKYDISKIVMDEGALGKKIGEELRRRHLIHVEPAEKQEKQSNVELLNDALRLGNFKAKKDSRFVSDSYLVQIDWEKTRPDKIIIKKQPHSDIIDAVLYAFKLTYAYTFEPKSVKLVYGSREWAIQEKEKMWNLELEGYMQEEADGEQTSYNNWILGRK